VVALAFLGRLEWNDKIAAAKTPAEFVRLRINEPKAAVQVQASPYHIDIDLSVAPWSATKSGAKTELLSRAKTLIPGTFAKFPSLSAIAINATAPYTDSHGHESQEAFISMWFTRKNAASINWSRVTTGNVPRLADSYWQSPSVKADVKAD
jgi:hypothetical protein